jgi:hypothetical protein
MSLDEFLSNQNIKMIWDVLIDEDIFKNKSKDIIAQMHMIFNKNIVPFYEKEKHTTSNLIELNKKFITILMNFVNRNFPTISQKHAQSTNQYPLQVQKKELITQEELQTDRQNEFERELSQKQKEFTSSMTLQVPQKPNFSDTIDKPISEMELEMKKMIAQRNYDLETANKSLSANDVENWLKPKETSVKADKIGFTNANTNTNTKQNVTQNTNTNTNTKQNVTQHANSSNNSIKYIKIDAEDISEGVLKKDIIELNSPEKKQISWADEKQDNNIFSKLKLLPHMLEEKENAKEHVTDSNKMQQLEYDIKTIYGKIDTINNNLNSILEILQKK